MLDRIRRKQQIVWEKSTIHRHSRVILVRKRERDNSHPESNQYEFFLKKKRQKTIIQVKLLLCCLNAGNLFNQPDYSDIQLVVESEHFHAHRIVLAARSDYFRALLYGGLRESQVDNHTIEIKECKAAAFRFLLLYIYTGRVNLVKEKVNVTFMR